MMSIILNYKEEDTSLKYKKHTIGDNNITSDIKLKRLEEENNKILLLNNVDISKIRYSHMPMFRYDIDNDIVNPKFGVFIPTRGKYFDNSFEPIELNKPKNLTQICVNSYSVDDNIQFIKDTLLKSKLGIVIFIHEPLENEDKNYKFNVLSKELRFFNLDEI